MDSDKECIENGESKFHLSRMVTTRLQKWSERAISHVKAAKELDIKSAQKIEKDKTTPEKILPCTNQIKELESALTELVNVHVNGSPPRQISFDEGDIEVQEQGEVVLCQNVLDENKEENKGSKTKERRDDNQEEQDRAKSPEKNNNEDISLSLTSTHKSTSDVLIKGPIVQENSRSGHNHVSLVRGSPHVKKKYQPAKMTGKLGSNETKLSEVLPIADKCDHDKEECCNRARCSSVNINTRNKQISSDENMKSQDDSAANKRPVPKRPVLRKHKSEGDILKQRVQLSLDFKDADICAFAAECLKAADLKQQQRKDSRVENTDSSPTSGTISTSPESGKTLQKQRQPRKTSKTEFSLSPPNSQSIECGNPNGRTMQKLSEDEEVEKYKAKDNGQRQLEIATKKLEKLIRKTETVQETHEDKRHYESVSGSNGGRKTSTDLVSNQSTEEHAETASIGENCPKIPIKLDVEELQTEKIEVKGLEQKSRKLSRDDLVKREDYEKKSSRRNSSQESEITLKSYKSLVKDNMCIIDGKNQSPDSGKKTLERLEMLRQDLNSKPKPKLQKFPSLPLFYNPSGMSTTSKSGQSASMEFHVIDDTLSGLKNLGLPKEKEKTGAVTEDSRLLHNGKEEMLSDTRKIGLSQFYVNEADKTTISLSTETKAGLSTFYTPGLPDVNSVTQS